MVQEMLQSLLALSKEVSTQLLRETNIVIRSFGSWMTEVNKEIKKCESINPHPREHQHQYRSVECHSPYCVRFRRDRLRRNSLRNREGTAMGYRTEHNHIMYDGQCGECDGWGVYYTSVQTCIEGCPETHQVEEETETGLVYVHKVPVRADLKIHDISQEVYDAAYASYFSSEGPHSKLMGFVDGFLSSVDSERRDLFTQDDNICHTYHNECKNSEYERPLRVLNMGIICRQTTDTRMDRYICALERSIGEVGEDYGGDHWTALNFPQFSKLDNVTASYVPKTSSGVERVFHMAHQYRATLRSGSRLE